MEPLQQNSWLNSILWLQWSRIEKPDQWDQFFTIYGPSSPLVVACLTLQILFSFEPLKCQGFTFSCVLSDRRRTITMSSQVRFVRSLILDKSLASHSIKAAAQVVSGSLASFTSKVSGVQLRDVQNSTLLAQLAATAKFPKQEQVEEWYNFYGNVLGELGWITQSFSFDTYKSDQASFKLSDVTLELLSPLVGGEKQVVKNTLDSFSPVAKWPNSVQYQ